VRIDGSFDRVSEALTDDAMRDNSAAEMFAAVRLFVSSPCRCTSYLAVIGV